MIFSNFTIFWLWEHIAREWEVIEFCENSWSSFNSLETNDGQTFWHKLQDSMTTQPPAIRSQTRKIGKFVKIMAQTFLNCDNMCDLTVLLASICYRKPRPGLLTLSAIFYELSDSYNIFSKAELRQFGASGTEGLNSTCWRTCIRKSWTKFGIIGHSEALGPTPRL